MKVLMVNHPDWTFYQGGDSVALKKTAEALRARGVEVVECHDQLPDATGYDIAHVFNVRTYATTARQVEAIHRAGVPIVLTPFYMTLGYSDWAFFGLVGALARPEAERPALFELYRTRQLTITSPDGKVRWRNPPIVLRLRIALTQEILARVQCLLPNSFLELDQLRKDLQVPDTPFAIIPLGIEPEPLLAAQAEPFVRRFGLKDFVLQVSRIEAQKNQLGLVYALRDFGVPLVLVGKTHSEDYAQACRMYGPRSLLIVPYLPAEELVSAYAAARVHVLANWTETCGLVSLEAALADCNLVCSTGGHELEFFRDEVYYCEPLDFKSIRRAVESAWTNFDRDAPRRNALRERMLRDMTWPRAAELTLDVYRRILAAKGQCG